MALRALPLLALALLSAALPAPASAEPYVQEQEYLLLPGCCTFPFAAGDTSLRLVLRDATGALGLSIGARAVVHDDSHTLLREVAFCGDSGALPLPAGADHVHVYPYDAALNAERCGPRTGLAPTAGTVEARMNGA